MNLVVLVRRVHCYILQLSQVNNKVALKHTTIDLCVGGKNPPGVALEPGAEAEQLVCVAGEQLLSAAVTLNLFCPL